MILLNSTFLEEEKQMEKTDSKGYVPLKTVGIDETFYGGRVKNVAKTTTDGVYLLVDRYGVFDILVKDLQSLTKAQLCFFAKNKFGVELNERDTKDELIKQIEQLL